MENKQKVKGVVAVLVMALAAGYGWSKSKNVTLGSVANNGNSGDRQRTATDEKLFAKVADDAGITKEQQKALTAAFEKTPPDWRAMATIVPDEAQRKKLRDGMMAGGRMGKTAKAALSADDFQRMQEKARERFRGRGPGGPGGGGGRGPGGGQGPGGGGAAAPAGAPAPAPGSSTAS